MVRGASPMISKGSPRFNMIVNKTASYKKKSPKARSTKKANNEENKPRASWNSLLEKSLVDLLHEHNTIHYRGQNGWSSEAWNKMVKEFHARNTYVSYTKSQVQEKEKELKREYKMIKEARKQSGVGWNDSRSMIEAEDALWDNLLISFPKMNKFKTKSFPLFEALGNLYDGQIAEGNYNVNSTQPPQHPDLTQIDNGEELSHAEATFLEFEETWAYSESVARTEPILIDADSREKITIDLEDENVARTEPKKNKRDAATVTRKRKSLRGQRSRVATRSQEVWTGSSK
uniref:Uncharacterized protein n=1 Tax=Avena sativa TaxID=4498 RepID=A0ACD5UYI9_AVESA